MQRIDLMRKDEVSVIIPQDKVYLKDTQLIVISRVITDFLVLTFKKFRYE